MIRLVVGLGNPGRRYVASRHNVGFLALDVLRDSLGLSGYEEKFSGLFTLGEPSGCSGAVALLKPTTFMNLSGSSVQMAMAFLKVDAASVIVLHDELDLGFGVVRVKVGGGHAGHNGLRSLMDRIASSEFVRVRIGVSRPPAGFWGGLGDYVLSGFDPVEQAGLPGVIEEAVDAVRRILMSGTSAAMNQVNARSS